MSPATILITGATDGLGRALAQRLADDGHDLVLHGRRPAALDDLADQISAQTGRRPRSALADLSSLAEVAALATTVAGFADRLDVLVNNAGIGDGQPDGTERQTSTDGFELRFAVNYLAPALLTLRLLTLLERSAPARIVNVASIGQQALDPGDLQLTRGYGGRRAYAQSKLALIVFGFELADRLDPARVTVNSLHPATYMPTKIVTESIGHSIDSIQEGVQSTQRLVLAEELGGVTGRFFNKGTDRPGGRPARSPRDRRCHPPSTPGSTNSARARRPPWPSCVAVSSTTAPARSRRQSRTGCAPSPALVDWIIRQILDSGVFIDELILGW